MSLHLFVILNIKYFNNTNLDVTTHTLWLYILYFYNHKHNLLYYMTFLQCTYLYISNKKIVWE